MEDFALTTGMGMQMITRSVTKPVIQNAIKTCKKNWHIAISEIGFQIAKSIVPQQSKVARKNAIDHRTMKTTSPMSIQLSCLLMEKIRL